MEELRARWEAIRQGQVDFGGQPTAAQVNEEESSDEDDTSEEDSGGSQDMPLSDRFTAIARAREALERNRHLQTLNQSRILGAMKELSVLPVSSCYVSSLSLLVSLRQYKSNL